MPLVQSNCLVGTNCCIVWNDRQVKIKTVSESQCQVFYFTIITALQIYNKGIIVISIENKKILLSFELIFDRFLCVSTEAESGHGHCYLFSFCYLEITK